MGCPSDEIHAPGSIARGGGKALSAEAGLWDEVDAALYAHPEYIDTVSLESRWMQRATAVVSGSRSLTTADQPPLEAALAALETTRAHVPDDLMLERLELDGDVEEGTGLVLRATFLVFADAEDDVGPRLAALQDAVPQARWELGRVVEAVRPDDRVTAAVAGAFDNARQGLRLEPSPTALRNGLRQHLAPLPGCADRRGARRWLGIPYGRRCGAVRVSRR